MSTHGRPFPGNLLARKAPEIFPRTPNRMRKKQHHLPAARLAQRVMAITPLFYRRVLNVSWTCVCDPIHLGEYGQGSNGKQRRKETSDSIALDKTNQSVKSAIPEVLTRIPPWIRESNSSPCTSTRETSAEAVISPIASIANDTRAKIRRMLSRYQEVSYHKRPTLEGWQGGKH